MEIDCLQRNETFKSQITLDRHNARPRLNYYVLPDPPHFSLPSTFKLQCVFTRETENISRGGPTIGEFCRYLYRGLMQDNTVARLQSTRVQTPISPLY
jgi:hypothetical protein